MAAYENDVYSFEEVLSEDVYDEGVNLEYLPENAVMASSIAPDYGVGTSNTAIFAGLARKLPYGVNYVYWREGKSTYVFAYGRDLELVGTTFRASSVDTVTYNTNSGYDRQASYVHGSESNFSLSANDYLVWSNLGHYPTLEDGRDTLAQTTLFVVVGYGIFYTKFNTIKTICQGFFSSYKYSFKNQIATQDT